MYNTNEFTNWQVNESFKKAIISGLAILFTSVILVSSLVFFSNAFEGTNIGYIIFPLFVISEIPILINYFYIVITKFGLIPKSGNSVEAKLAQLISLYYTSGLIFHSGLYTIVIGLVFAHMLLLIQQSSYCVILMLILGLIWIIECIFWILNWPLYPKEKEKTIFLYWIHWSLLFGLLIGLPFHIGAWSLLWMIISPLITFGPLLLLIAIDILEFRYRKQQERRIEAGIFPENYTW